MRSDDGSWQINPAELHRVHPFASEHNGTMLRDLPGTPAGDALTERDRLVAEQAETIRDLCARLDRSEAERRQLSELLTGLLTHRQIGGVPAVPARRGWRSWFRW